MKRLILVFALAATGCGSSTTIQTTVSGGLDIGRQRQVDDAKNAFVPAFCVGGSAGSSVLRFLAQESEQEFPASTMILAGEADPYPLTRISALRVFAARSVSQFLFSAEPIDPVNAPTGPGSAKRKVYVAAVPRYAQKAAAKPLFDVNGWKEAALAAFRAKGVEAASFALAGNGDALVLQGAGRDSRLVLANAAGLRRAHPLDYDAESLANPEEAGDYFLFDAFDAETATLRKYAWSLRDERGSFVSFNGPDKAQFGGGEREGVLFWFELGESLQLAYGAPDSARRIQLPVRGAVVPKSVAWKRTFEGLELAVVTHEASSLFTAWSVRIRVHGASWENAAAVSVPVTKDDWRKAHGTTGDAAGFRFSGDLTQLLVMDRTEGIRSRVVGLDLKARRLGFRGRTQCAEIAVTKEVK